MTATLVDDCRDERRASLTSEIGVRSESESCFLEDAISGKAGTEERTTPGATDGWDDRCMPLSTDPVCEAVYEYECENTELGRNKPG